MALLPGADYRPLNLHGGAMTGHNFVCIHTMVGSLWGTDAYFQSGSANAHFGTGGDGHIVQWLDTTIQSWANLDGNPDVISIENADMGPEFAAWNTSDGSAVPAFTEAQLEAIARIVAWACSRASHAACPSSWTCHSEGIPMVLIPDDVPGRRGVGYHRHGIDWWRVPAGTRWSSKTGKVCPGDRRIAQVPQILQLAISGQEGFLMALSDQQQTDLYNNVMAANSRLESVYTWLRGGDPTKDNITLLWQMVAELRTILVGTQPRPADGNADRLADIWSNDNDNAQKILDKLDALEAAVVKLAPPAAS